MDICALPRPFSLTSSHKDLVFFAEPCFSAVGSSFPKWEVNPGHVQGLQDFHTVTLRPTKVPGSASPAGVVSDRALMSWRVVGSQALDREGMLSLL